MVKSAPVWRVICGGLLLNSCVSAEPHRRAGLWEVHLTMENSAYALPVSRLCLDDSAERRMTLVGAQMNRDYCNAYRLSPAHAGAWSFYSDCSVDDAQDMTTQGEITGDLASAYRAVVTGVVSRKSDHQTVNEMKLTVDARRIGDCPAGMTGGAVSSGGRTYNVFESGR